MATRGALLHAMDEIAAAAKDRCFCFGGFNVASKINYHYWFFQQDINFDVY